MSVHDNGFHLIYVPFVETTEVAWRGAGTRGVEPRYLARRKAAG